ncbi:solute carrier family 35 member C2-like isoform X5 [Apostichopus japonicus]|uniref:solute carrier family 35 member C2-like isoform X1 n=1 Tax=Stichopus japonicus TaxID=307972 RepID=UPI003AB8E988
MKGKKGVKSHVQRTRRQLHIAGQISGKVDNAIYKAAPQSVRKTRWYSLFYQTIKTISLVLFYYCFSISLTFYNKWLFSDFRFPLSITICHLTVKFVMAAIVRSFLDCATDITPVTLSWKVYLTKVAPTGLASVFDIGFSNWSMLYITIELYTMSKSTAVIFILVFGIIFHLQEPHLSQVVVIFLISGGLFMFTYHSTSFNLMGFVLVITASVLSGIRWSLAQILTQHDSHEGGLRNPVDTIYHLQPIMILGLLPLAIPVEGLQVASSSRIFGFSDEGVLMFTMATTSLGAILAFMLALSEYLLVSQTSSLTLSISGIFKEIVVLYLAITFSKDGSQLLIINKLGMVICLLGITFHVYIKAKEINKKPPVVPPGKHKDSIPMLADGEANVSSDSEEEIYTRGRDISWRTSVV